MDPSSKQTHRGYTMFGFGDVVAILILTWVCMLYIAMDLAGVIS